MRQDGETLLQAILANPADDGPRLAFADWLEERGTAADRARAEFIRVQCAVAGMDDDDPQRPDLEYREWELLREHRKTWTEPVRDLVEHCAFRRGFVSMVAVQPRQFLENAKALFALAPVDHIKFEGSTPRWPGLLAASRRPKHVLCLDFSGAGREMGEEGIRTLAESHLLAGVRDLRLWDCSIGDAGVEALVTSPSLKRITRLELLENRITEEGAQTLAASKSMAGLKYLNLVDNRLRNGGARALAESRHLKGLEVLRLGGCRLTNAGARALASSPSMAGLVELDLCNNRIGNRGGDALAASPHLRGLRSLGLAGNQIDEAALRALFSPHLFSLPKAGVIYRQTW